MKSRILAGLVSGAILGVFCIIGASTRNPDATGGFFFAFWFNRVVMGLAIGMTGNASRNVMLAKGLILGTVISFAFFSTTGFEDLLGFLAGIVYGVIIGLAVYLAQKYREPEIEH